MSSAIYATELQPDPRMRRVVLLMALLAGGSGIWVLATLPVDPLLRVLATIGWLAWVGINCVRRHAAGQKLQRIRMFADGTAALLGPDGSWSPATVAGGSVVLAGLAWLKLETSSSLGHTELIRRNSQKNDDWRRLQVISRHQEKGAKGALGSSS